MHIINMSSTITCHIAIKCYNILRSQQFFTGKVAYRHSNLYRQVTPLQQSYSTQISARQFISSKYGIGQKCPVLNRMYHVYSQYYNRTLTCRLECGPTHMYTGASLHLIRLRVIVASSSSDQPDQEMRPRRQRRRGGGEQGMGVPLPIIFTRPTDIAQAYLKLTRIMSRL